MRRSKLGLLLMGNLVGLLLAPWAVATAAAAINGAQRNPSNNLTSAYHRETQVIGNIAAGKGGLAPGTGGFVTRQSNKSSSGGGAVYGCRARAGTDPCVEAVNLSTGYAFTFLTGTGANSAGAILIGPDLSKTVDKPPFVTNAAGLVHNLNADMVGGEHASDLVSTRQLPFADVDAGGHLGANRGATAATFTATPASGTTGPSGPSASTTPTYTVTFANDVSKCAYTATPNSISAGSIAAAPGPAGPGTQVHSVIVTESGSPTGFSLTVTC